MTWDEEENAVRQLGDLIGYERLIQHAHQLQDRRKGQVRLEERERLVQSDPILQEAIQRDQRPKPI